MTTSSAEGMTTGDLDFRWDPRAAEATDRVAEDADGRRDLGEYFTFLADVTPGGADFREPPAPFAEKFDL